MSCTGKSVARCDILRAIPSRLKSQNLNLFITPQNSKLDEIKRARVRAAAEAKRVARLEELVNKRKKKAERAREQREVLKAQQMIRGEESRMKRMEKEDNVRRIARQKAAKRDRMRAKIKERAIS